MPEEPLKDKIPNRTIIVRKPIRRPIVVPRHTRERRRREIHELYESVRQNSDQERELIYNDLKKNHSPSTMIDLFYDLLGKDLANVLTKVQEIYNTYEDEPIIELEDVLYKKDGKTLEERIYHWFKEYNKPSQIQSLFFKLCNILNTEKHNMVSQVIKLKTKVEYIEVFRNCDDCYSGICEEYCDEEVHRADEWDEPPYHTNCECEAIFYEEYDLDPDDPTI